MYMNTNETFFWYDLETFGLNPHYDRIAQFAGQRTDRNLNPIGAPVLLYCKLSDDYLPDPLSCLITSITPQEVQQRGMCESDLIDRINQEFSKPGTCVAGFNSVRFDDEFIRNALYRNFLDPYRREWSNGNSRWDIIDLVRAAYDLRPEGIEWPPKKENGNPAFKLTELTAANNISHEGAHDALSDVNATIAVAKLIKEKQPKLFAYYLGLRKKAKVKELLQVPLGEPVLYTSAQFTTPNGCSHLVMPITAVPNNPNSIICFDLSYDIATLLRAGEEDIMRIPGVLKIAMNKCPFISTMKVLTPDLAIKLGIDVETCMFRYNRLTQESMLPVFFRNAAERDEYEQVRDPDFRIYADGFFQDSDQRKFMLIRGAEPSQKLNLNLQFEDQRCPQMLWRHVCRNWPEVLTDDEARKWRSFAANRLLNPPGEAPVNLAFFKRKVAEKLESTDTTPKEKIVLSQLKAYGDELVQKLFEPEGQLPKED